MAGDEAVVLPNRARIALHALRAAPALTMVIHGTARIVAGGVEPFGGFLSSLGLPGGHAVAWLITVVEIAGGLTLASGRFVVPLCIWFVMEHLVGITTVHAPNGWFAVGLGRNGMEYSVLLITCFVIVAIVDPAWRAGGASGDVHPPKPAD